MKTNDIQLSTLFEEADYIKVSLDDGQYVNQNITSTYATFLFKNQNPTQQETTIKWNGQSNLAPSISTIYLQIYNRTSGEWEELDHDDTTDANTDFDLDGSISANLGNYFNVDGWIACRIYQQGVT